MAGRDKVSGWWLAGPASDFVVRDVCYIWNTQDITKAPLVESIDSSTGGGRHTPRVCTIEEYREYVHIVKSDLGVLFGTKKDELVRFCGQKVKGQVHSEAKYGQISTFGMRHGLQAARVNFTKFTTNVKLGSKMN